MWLCNKSAKILAKEEYEREYIKQTDAYSYYLKSKELEQVIKKYESVLDKTNEGEHENVPFICIKETEEIKQVSEDDGYKIYENDEYYIYESKKGSSSDLEKAKLVTYAKKLNADLIYSDVENITCDGKKRSFFYKPCFGTDTNRCFSYFTDFYAVKKEKSKIDISLYEKIEHVPEVLFHYNSYNNDENLSDEYFKNNISYLTDEFYVDNIEFDGIKDRINIIIPSKDNPNLIEKCLKGIKEAKVKSGINTLNVVIVDNGSTDIHKEEITHVINVIKSGNSGLSIDYLYDPKDFNFSDMCNTGAKHALGTKTPSEEYFLFMNDDIEITDDLFLLKLLFFAKMDHVGAVGCKLLYPGEENRIQHVGITCLKYPGPSHKLSTFVDDKPLYFGRNRGVHNCLAVTGACLMVSAEKFFKIGGFCDKMKVGYNDVDLCVLLYENGYKNVVNNECVLIHHESITRGSDAASETKLQRLDAERNLLYERHPWLLTEGDPYYNPNLAEDFLDYRVNVIPDFERRDYVSSARSDLSGYAEKCEKAAKVSKDMFLNIESRARQRGYIEVSGWALINKKENYLYDTYLAIVLSDGECKLFDTARVKREDLYSVFPDASFTDLSGFFARIPIDEFGKDQENAKYGVLMVNKQTGKKYYAGFREADI